MKIAVIDLGTNTFNLLIAELSGDNTCTDILRTKRVVKLGEGGLNDAIIQPLPYQRGIEAMKAYQQLIEQHGVEKTVAFATSAVRGARNGKEFVAAIKSATGIEVNIIDGDEEARLIYHGVKAAVDLGNEPKLIMDIGGGSTEFIIADKTTIYWQQSFLLGVSRLLQKIPLSDPVQPNEIATVVNYLEQTLQPLAAAIKLHHPRELIGSSGSFDSFAEMIAHQFYTPELLDNVTEYQFVMSEYEQIAAGLLASTQQERLAMKGLIPMRADMIVIAVILVNYIIQNYSIRKMKLSTYSLKEGVLVEWMDRKNN